MGERGWREPASPKISSGKARKHGSFAGDFYFCPEWVRIWGHFHTDPPTITTIFLVSAASAQTSRILHTSLGPPDPAPPQERLTLSSPGPHLFTSEWLPCSTPHPQPHTLLFLLLVLFWPGCVSPALVPRVAQGSRPPPARVGRTKPVGARVSLLVGPRASRLNRCPCHRAITPRPGGGGGRHAPCRAAGTPHAPAQVPGAPRALAAPPRP